MQLSFANQHFYFKDCKYYPCHKIPEGQRELNCIFCYCPFYPCNGKLGEGHWINQNNGKKVFDCSDCSFIHRNKVVTRFFQLLYEGKPLNKIKKLLIREKNKEKKGKIVLGIFGKTGSGKSILAEIISKKFGYIHIEVDKVAHLVLNKNKKKVVKLFGKEIISENGTIDRGKLGEIVFSDIEKNKLLTSLLHPRIKKEVEKIIKRSKGKYFVIDAALLFEIGLDEICNFLIFVESKPEKCITRTMSSKKWSEEKVIRVLKLQEDIDTLKSRADFIIMNDSDIKSMEEQLDDFIKSYLTKS